MTIQELYEVTGSDYADVSSRLPMEALIAKLVVKYPDDKSFGQLEEALGAKDYDAAFSAAHSLKGVASNLGFAALSKPASELTEKLRAKETDGLDGLFEEAKAAHEKLIECIPQLD